VHDEHRHGELAHREVGRHVAWYYIRALVPLDHLLFRLLHHRAGSLPLCDVPTRLLARYGAHLEVGLMVFLGVSAGEPGRSAVRRCLAVVGLQYVLIELVGRLAGRMRPFSARQGARPLVEHGAKRSFPSRHAASAVAMAVVCWPVSTAVARAMALTALALGVARVRAGLHYPSDVLAGAGIGYLAGRALRPMPETSS
jgi:undecaprenyl-diphosphatase